MCILLLAEKYRICPVSVYDRIINVMDSSIVGNIAVT
jgi:hypothetical protein